MQKKYLPLHQGQKQIVHEGPFGLGHRENVTSEKKTLEESHERFIRVYHTAVALNVNKFHFR